MTRYDVLRNADKDQMASFLTAIFCGMLRGLDSAAPEIKESMLEFLDEEAGA